MAQAETADRAKPALALSGGGFRATLYHVGALIRLNELGWLSRLERVSSVSGGSITSAVLAAVWPRLAFQDGIATNLDAEIVRPLRKFCTRALDTYAVGWGAISPFSTAGDVLADAYDDLLGGITLQALPDKPQFVFNATNLQTGRLVRMGKVRLADYRLGEIPKPTIRLAVAVAASSAFPPVLSPVTIKIDPASWVRREGAIHFGDPAYNRTLSLTDGGAYDNLGLETVDDFATIFVSDAGAPFATHEEESAFWPKQAMRALDIATDQSRGLRKRLLQAECAASGRVYAYAGIDSDPARYPAPRTLVADPLVTAGLARLRTRLDPFSEEEQGRLINWGWYMTDVAVRSYIETKLQTPTTWPVPAWPLS